MNGSRVNPRPGEVMWKEWRCEMARQLGVAPVTIQKRVAAGTLTMPRVRRQNARVIYVLKEAA